MSKNTILAKAENMFLENGYKNTTMRKLAENINLTTGAIYGYFQNKSLIYDAIVKERAEIIFENFLDMQTRFDELKTEDQIDKLSLFIDEGLHFFIDSFCSQRALWKLLVCSSEGTNYENYLNRFLEQEINSTKRYLDDLSVQIPSTKDITDETIMALVKALYKNIFEIIKKDMDREQAEKYLSIIFEFYQAGWEKIIYK